MARIGEVLEETKPVPVVEIEPVEEIVGTVTKEEPVPSNVEILSSGVRVQFVKKLPPTVAQQVVVTTFQNANLAADGTVKDDMTSNEQLQLAQRMFDYNKALLSFGLSSGSIKLYDGLPKDTVWLDYLELNPQVRNDNPNVDFKKKVHQELLYLLYVAFATDKDLELIQTKLLDR